MGIRCQENKTDSFANRNRGNFQLLTVPWTKAGWIPIFRFFVGLRQSHDIPRWRCSIFTFKGSNGSPTLGWLGDIWRHEAVLCAGIFPNIARRRGGAARFVYPLYSFFDSRNRLRNQHKLYCTLHFTWLYNHYHEPWINVNQHELAEIGVRDVVMQFVFLKFEFLRFGFLRSSEWESGGKTQDRRKLPCHDMSSFRPFQDPWSQVAVWPYDTRLCWKLVCLKMTSPTVVSFFNPSCPRHFSCEIPWFRDNFPFRRMWWALVPCRLAYMGVQLTCQRNQMSGFSSKSSLRWRIGDRKLRWKMYMFDYSVVELVEDFWRGLQICLYGKKHPREIWTIMDILRWNCHISMIQSKWLSIFLGRWFKRWNKSKPTGKTHPPWSIDPSFDHFIISYRITIWNNFPHLKHNPKP